MLLHGFLEEFQRGLLVPCLRHEAFQHLALVVDGPPQVMPLAIDFHENFIQVPPPMAGSHTLDPPFPDLGREQRAEPVPPEPHSLMADVDAAFMQQIFDIPE